MLYMMPVKNKKENSEFAVPRVEIELQYNLFL